LKIVYSIVKDSLYNHKGLIVDFNKVIELNPNNAEYYYRSGKS